MASDTDSLRRDVDPPAPRRDADHPAHRRDTDHPALRWSLRWSVGTRILAVNIIAMAMLAGGFFYLDSYRSRLVDTRLHEAEIRAQLIAAALDAAPPAERRGIAVRLAAATEQRIRIYAADGARLLDSDRAGPAAFVLIDPHTEPWRRHVARFMDRAIDFVTGATTPEDYVEPPVDRLSAWPEAAAAITGRTTVSMSRRAPDRTFVISAATPLGRGAGTLLTVSNARDITRIVRAERTRLGVVLAVVVLLSVLLSLFLARTIVRPLRRLAVAAHRVRLGRAREVSVPFSQHRRDEIGTLARALSDMSTALRQRIEATEAFAADVTHELKNPLASLRSAIDSLDRVTDEALRDQLKAVVRDDVRRLDRLITDISEASRVDAELARARFETIDLGGMIEGLVAAREASGVNGDVRVAFARPYPGTAIVLGDGARLTRTVENLIDNAVSFSPLRGLVAISATRDGDVIVISVDDEGPGVPREVRDDIFRRFHSIRPEGEAFGRHSGLGLAIAKATVEGHNGTIAVQDRDDAQSGARFVIRLPIAEDA